MKKTGWQDVPVASIADDMFNISVYINGLCSFIRNCDTPMTISIQGDWGSGKTSMMNMIRENLQGTIHPIWFNTWQFSQFDAGNELVFSMMEILLESLGCNAELHQKILNGLLGFGKTAIKVITERGISGEAAEKVGEMMNGSDVNYASEILHLKERFQQAINDRLKNEHKDRVVIFVDDLDRLQPLKAVELLEALKMFLDCENCVFVLAVDYEVVTSGIRQKFNAGVDDEKGKSFFDKIIQLPFKMPVAQYNIKNCIGRMMEQLSIPTDYEDVELFYHLIRFSIGFNPRSMKRLFNTYELLDRITKSSEDIISDTVRKRVLFAVVCVQMCFEQFYLYLTSVEIDEELFITLGDSDACVRELENIYAETKISNTERLVKKLSDFLPYFLQAVQLNQRDDISEKKLQNLRTILKSSTVTSVAAGVDEESVNSAEWEYRNTNKELVKQTISLLTDIGSFSIWMPRKARGEIKLSDASGYYTWTASIGFNCQIEFYLSRIDSLTTGVHIKLMEASYKKSTGEHFIKMLGENPLQLHTLIDIDEFGYTYLNALRLNNNDPSAAEQIAAVVRSAYEVVCSILSDLEIPE